VKAEWENLKDAWALFEAEKRKFQDAVLRMQAEFDEERRLFEEEKERFEQEKRLWLQQHGAKHEADAVTSNA
jgi:molecular chaperone GrpE (heat shock protein)